MDIIQRAARLVDHLVIGIASNDAKGPLFQVAERVEIVRHEVAPVAKQHGIQITVEPFAILLMHFAENVGASMIVRGLRAVSDFEYEFQMVGMNMQINPNIETVFLMADAHNQAIASRLVKEICALGGDVKSFVSPYVEKKLLQKYKERRLEASVLDGAKTISPRTGASQQARAALLASRRPTRRPRR
jgi:pantetheine-phosphate adenylyltransferase